jgi:hypothetical protein
MALEFFVWNAFEGSYDLNLHQGIAAIGHSAGLLIDANTVFYVSRTRESTNEEGAFTGLPVWYICKLG